MDVGIDHVQTVVVNVAVLAKFASGLLRGLTRAQLDQVRVLEVGGLRRCGAVRHLLLDSTAFFLRSERGRLLGVGGAPRANLARAVFFSESD